MSQESKDLLIKDLSARLPYGVKCEYTSIQKGFEIHNEIGELSAIDKDVTGCEHIYAKIDGQLVGLSDFKPYLRPLSSMTDDEFEDVSNLWNGDFDKGLVLSINGDWDEKDVNREVKFIEFVGASKVIDWLNAHHFDFRNLIEKGLALEATKDMYNKE